MMAAPHKILCALILTSTWTMAAGTARAFSSPDAYAQSPSAGGGGGRWFSGSPADGLGCSACHSAAPGQRIFPLYVSGLPLAGYGLASRQEILLSWPEFARRWTEIRPNPMAPAMPNQPSPGVGLVAEMVAESGKASGTIEISTAAAEPAQLCEQTRPNLQPRLGVKLYQVRPGLDPLLIKPDSTGFMRCEARQLGQRCIIALTSCGAQEVRFTWTAPPTSEGPIWFSAGFVASEALSGTFEQDSVQEISLPLLQAGTPSAMYQETLHSACALVRSRSRPSLGMLALGALAAVLLVRRARGREKERR
jgi:hypothetical protein